MSTQVAFVLTRRNSSCVRANSCRDSQYQSTHLVDAFARRLLAADAIDGTSAPNEAGARVYELLAKAKWENGRAAAPAASKRRAKASTRWVDWY